MTFHIDTIILCILYYGIRLAEVQKHIDVQPAMCPNNLDVP